MTSNKQIGEIYNLLDSDWYTEKKAVKQEMRTRHMRGQVEKGQ